MKNNIAMIVHVIDWCALQDNLLVKEDGFGVWMNTVHFGVPVFPQNNISIFYTVKYPKNWNKNFQQTTSTKWS
jgi:hypothetical protein